MIGIAREGLESGIVARDEQLVAFYEETLGLTRASASVLPFGKLVRFAVRSSIIKILIPSEPPDSHPAGGLPWAATGHRWFSIYVTDLDDVLERCASAGCTPLAGVQSPAPGVRFAIVPDPEGNCIEFAEVAS